MARYIDAEKIINIINPKGVCGPLVRLKDVMRAIAITPTADVAPVVHAHWIEKSYDWGYKNYLCSDCGRFEQVKSAFCRCCGAKMDEEVKEDV